MLKKLKVKWIKKFFNYLQIVAKLDIHSMVVLILKNQKTLCHIEKKLEF